MTKKQLEAENQRLKAIMRNAGIDIEGRRAITLTDQIEKMEEDAHIKIFNILDTLTLKTGKVPSISIEIRDPKDKSEPTKMITMPVFTPANHTKQPLRTAVQKLVTYCFNNGDFQSKSRVRTWIRSYLEDCS